MSIAIDAESPFTCPKSIAWSAFCKYYWMHTIRRMRWGNVLTQQINSEKRRSGREQNDRLNYRMCQGRVCPVSQQ